MKVLVTGGAGFIGSHIVEELLKGNYEPVIIDNLLSGCRENIPEGVVFYQADIKGDLDSIFREEKPDFVIHQAAQVSVTKSIENPLYDADENILGTLNLLDACIKYDVKKFVFASSAAVYGEPQFLPINEEHTVNPISFYGLSKLHAEKCIQLYSKLYGLNYTILRYANVFGPRQDINGEAGVIAIFIEKFLNQKPLSVFGDGLQTRDFVYVKDVAKANIASLNQGDRDIFNIGTNVRTSIIDLIDSLEDVGNRKISPKMLKKKEGDIQHSLLSNQKAQKNLQWIPSFGFDIGLGETIEDYQEKRVELI
ncbi:NAD-dependent epimerase/dehydratase family protein [Halobacillus litoralis]|uniref:NAD-dependent epimerase/dehydratase family protein n=1 Tax=Halobacillus litoralis TaxID=45668 RepID=UPI001CFD99E5|nr:NAD-dependent epimerase/dehydratase family protein [Halobacillus litoralis]